MTQITPSNSTPPLPPGEEADSNRGIYLLGAAAGAVFGLLSAYFYNRAAEENARQADGKKQEVPTRHLISLALAALGLMRQISEMGKPNKK